MKTTLALSVATLLLVIGATKAATASVFSPFETPIPPGAFYGAVPGDTAQFAPGGPPLIELEMLGLAPINQLGSIPGLFTFDAMVHGFETAVPFGASDFTGSGQMMVTTLSPGLYQIEITSLLLTGSGGTPPSAMLRESPTLQSLGQMTTTPDGGGFQITSFFDIFTELSLDGGSNWAPTTNGPLTMELQAFQSPMANVPEPSSMVLLGTGVVGLVVAARRRRR